MNEEMDNARLENSLERLLSGDSQEQILAESQAEERAALERELAGLADAARLAAALESRAPVPAAAQDRSRAAFLQAAVKARPARRWKIFGAALRPGWALAAALLVLAAGLTGTSLASAKSLPGDNLYPVKLAVEQTRIRMTRDPAQRLELEREFDQERVNEVEALFGHQRSDEVDFAGYLSIGENGQWMVEDIVLVFPPGFTGAGDLSAGQYVEVHGVPMPDDSVWVEDIEPRVFEFRGALQEMQAQVWRVGGIDVLITGRTRIEGQPFIGAGIEVQAAQVSGGQYEAILLEVRSLRSKGEDRSPELIASTPTPDVDDDQFQPAGEDHSGPGPQGETEEPPSSGKGGGEEPPDSDPEPTSPPANPDDSPDEPDQDSD